MGSTTKVSRVEEINPPMTTVASGFWTSAPALVEMAIGRNPNEATNAVITTGLSLISVPFITMANRSVKPSFLNLLNSPMSTIPFKTATPNKAINPIPAEILKGISLNQSANIPPIAEKGTAV